MTPPTDAAAPAVAEADGDVRWLSDVEQRSWRTFVSTVNDLMRAFDVDLAPTGLDMGDYQVLVYLSEAEGNHMRMCDLAEELQLSPSGLTRRLDGLVRAGLVERVASDDDRRVMLAEMTPAGRRRLREVAPVHVASVRRHLIDRLDADQVRALGDIFTAVSAGLHDRDDRDD